MDGEWSTRRQYLLALGTLGTTGLAGCTSDTSPDSETESGLFNNSTGAATATETATETPSLTPTGDVRPDFGGYLDGANNFSGTTVDARGQDEVTVRVGAGDGLAFGPPAVHIDNGATVVWEWNGEGGAHNVVAEDGSFDSEDIVGEAGHTFEHRFEVDGIYTYYCVPHKGAGMLGAVVVGDDFPTKPDNREQSSVPAEQYLNDARNYEGVAVDGRDYSELVVNVGAKDGLSFDPVAVHVEPGTTVRWEWTGEGGAHNVVSEEDHFESGSPEESGTFEYHFDIDGIYRYYCAPHKGVGMKAAIIVGDDYSPAYSGAAPPEGGGGGGSDQPDFQGYLDGANNYNGQVVNRTGQAETRVDVGTDDGLAFGPAAIHVDNGATVVWEWTGDGGAHSVVEANGRFDSGDTVAQAGHTFSHQFTADGIYPYYCRPHRGVGMLGVVVVGTDYPTE